VAHDGRGSLWDDSARLRANPAYAVVSRDALPSSLATLAHALEGTPELYGVALPRDAAPLTPKALDCDTALLLLSLREPGTLPWFARVRLGHRAVAAVETLLLEGVLEVERDGAFVSGPALLAQAAPLGPGASRVARLSHAALAYGAALPVDDALTLARRLYAYHGVPLSPAWQARLPDREAVEHHLGLDRPDTRRLLAAGWTADHAATPHADRYWLSWDPRRRVDARRGDAAYKLYVSPVVERIGDALAAVVDALARSGGAPFKVGAHVRALLRPDRMVIYLDHLDAVYALGAALRDALRGIPGHGVPFTGPITADGLLSWGIDPPRGEAAGLHGSRSWRARVTTRLATALLEARRQGAPAAAATRFAVERVRRAGVDPETWAPRGREWEATDADD
jgi:hypothetical protein